MMSEQQYGQIDVTEVMGELRYIRDTVERNSKQLERITVELSGNGGPGLRTRIYALETGYTHVVERLRVIEAAAEKRDICIDDVHTRINIVQDRVNKIYYMVAGVGAGLVILQALQWVIPALLGGP